MRKELTSTIRLALLLTTKIAFFLGLFLAPQSCKTLQSPNSAVFVDSSSKVKICEDLSKFIAKDSDLDEEKIHAEMRKASLDQFGFQGSMACAQLKIQSLKAEGKPVPFNLSTVEAAMLMSYSREAYNTINSALRRGDCSAFKMSSRALASGVNKILGYHGPLYRGATLTEAELNDLYSVGKTVTAPMFLSTSAEYRVARRFSTNVLFEIENGSGGALRDLSHFPSEEEVLIPPGTQFRVIEIETNHSLIGSNRTVTRVRMSQITQSPDNAF